MLNTDYYAMGRFDGSRATYDPPYGMTAAEAQRYDAGYEYGVVHSK